MKSKGHLYMANVMLDFIANPGGQITLPGGIRNTFKISETVKESILKYPSYFRAGAVGPDFFPDLIFEYLKDFDAPPQKVPLESFLRSFFGFLGSSFGFGGS